MSSSRTRQKFQACFRCSFMFTGREWSDLGSRDIDGCAGMGNRRSERERASQWLSDLKLYDFRARLYQPELGRFMQPNPKEFGAGDYNLYRYCHNDPVNKTDPMGLLEVVLEEYKRIPFSNLKELVRTKFEVFTSLIDAGKAGGKAAGPAAMSDHSERYGGIGHVLKTLFYIYSHPVTGTYDKVRNYSELRTAPLPNGVERVGGNWVLGRLQET